MAMIPGDERELLLPLYAGLHERPVWTTFLARLRARTGATRTVLIIGAPDQTARAVIHQSPAHSPESLESLVAALPLPMNAMRPGRVYALDESPVPPSPTPDQPRIAYGRLLRIAPAEDLHAWLFLLHDRADFAAADSALLSGLAPHLSVAIETALRLDLLSLRAEMAEDALALLGIAQAALNADGQVIAGTLPATDGAPRALTAPLARAFGAARHKAARSCDRHLPTCPARRPGQRRADTRGHLGHFHARSAIGRGFVARGAAGRGWRGAWPHARDGAQLFQAHLRQDRHIGAGRSGALGADRLGAARLSGGA